MKLFNLGKNKESKYKEKIAMCGCENMCKVSSIENQENTVSQNDKFVKILGSGCKKCNELEVATKKALSNLEMDTEIEHITDFSKIASYGVMTTPALVLGNKVVAFGKVLKVEEIEKIIKNVKF